MSKYKESKEMNFSANNKQKCCKMWYNLKTSYTKLDYYWYRDV